MSDWVTQAEELVNSWSATQQKVWGTWAELSPEREAVPVDPNRPPLRQLAEQGIRAWTDDADATVRSVTNRLFATQDALIRFLELAAAAWRSITPSLETEQEWHDNLRDFLDQARRDLTPEQRIDRPTAWQTYLQRLHIPWLGLPDPSTAETARGLSPAASVLLSELTNLYWDAYESTFGRMPGYPRELDEKIRHSFEAWLDFQQASFEYQVVLADAWVKALEQLIREMVQMVQRGEAMDSLRELILRWTSVSDSVFTEVFASEPYIRAQSRMLNASMAYRLKHRGVLEELLKLNDLPTRSELDEAHRRIYELRKEVKALRKALDEIKAGKQD